VIAYHREGSTMANASVIEWLLVADPSIRWQVMRDLLDAPADEVAAERAKVATQGWGRELLARQAPDGAWGGTAWNHGWNSTMHVLWLLREMGLDPASVQARHAIELVRERVQWSGDPAFEGNAFFVGEVEPCINGQVAAVGEYFGQDVQAIIERLLAEQLDDGGWNCEAERGSTRSSFNTTICVLEALLEHERTHGRDPQVHAARLRGEAYLLDRKLMRRLSTGEMIEHDRKSGTVWTRFAFPTWWAYDVLRALDYLRSAGVAPDGRVAAAFDLLISKRDAEGRWPLEARHEGEMPIELDEREGQPSRWNTLRALRVLRWLEAAWRIGPDAVGEPLFEQFRNRVATLGIDLYAEYKSCGIFGDLEWTPKGPRGLEAYQQRIDREPAFTVEGHSRWLAFARICGDVRYFAGPLPAGTDPWRQRDEAGRRAIEAESDSYEIGVLNGIDDAVRFAAAYLGGAAFEQIGVPRRCGRRFAAAAS
jgi:hypothetical protein